MSHPLERQWTLFLVPFSHVDIGFSNAQKDVLQLQILNLSGKVDAQGKATGALELIEKTKAFPENARFKFTSEVSWAVLEMLKSPTVPQKKKEQLIAALQKGDIEVGGFYINHTNKFLDGEALIRSTLAASSLARTFHVSLRSAMLNDVGDASSVIEPLYRAGIRYFVYGPNTLHYFLPPLFWLRSPAKNDAKLLTWLTSNLSGYAENVDWNLRPPMPKTPFHPHNPAMLVSSFKEKIFKNLHWIEEKGFPLPEVRQRYCYGGKQWRYPYDAYLILYYPAHAGDNGHQDITPSLLARWWNRKFLNPRLKVATLSEFFLYIEKKWANAIPEIQGDFTGFWGEQNFLATNQIDPKKEEKCRRSYARLQAAEAFHALSCLQGSAQESSQESFQEAYEKLLLLSDHNPAPVSFSGNRFPKNSSGKPYRDPDVPLWKKTRQTWIQQVEKSTNTILSQSAEKLFSHLSLPSGKFIAVFNSLSFKRTDIVTLSSDADLPEATNIVDVASNTQVPCSKISSPDSNKVSFLFLARDVPSFGYKLFRIEKKKERQTISSFSFHQTEREATVENAFYKLKMQKQQEKWNLVELKDKEMGWNIAGGKPFNHFTRFLRPETLGNLVFLKRRKPFFELQGLEEASLALHDYSPVAFCVQLQGKINLKKGVHPILFWLSRNLVQKLLGTKLASKDTRPLTLTQQIWLYRDLKRIDFHQTFSFLPLTECEHAFLYLFGTQVKKMKLELPYNFLCQEEEELCAVPMKKSAISFFNFPFLWMEGLPRDYRFTHSLSLTGQGGICTFSSRESGLVCQRRKSGFAHVGIGPTLVGQLLVGTRRELRPFTLHSALTSSPRSNISDTHALSFGWSYTHPLLPFFISVLDGQKEKKKANAKKSFLEITPPNLFLTVFKRAEDGNGFILRLWETSGKQTKGTIKLLLRRKIKRACKTTSTEFYVKDIVVGETRKTVPVELQPGEVQTIRLEVTDENEQ